MPRLDLPPEIEAIYLDELREAFECSTDDARASVLFRAIRFCGDQQLAQPEWVVAAFAKATNEWFSQSVGTLDEAFGTVAVTAPRLAQKRRNKLLLWQARVAVNEAKAMHVSINGDFYARLAEKLGSNKTGLQDLLAHGTTSKKKRTPRMKCPDKK
jgi:hypothetical protein